MFVLSYIVIIIFLILIKMKYVFFFFLLLNSLFNYILKFYSKGGM